MGTPARSSRSRLALRHAGRFWLVVFAISGCAVANASTAREFQAVFGEPEVARVVFDERPGGVFVTFLDDGAPTGPSAGRYGLIVGVRTTCDSDAPPVAFNPHHAGRAAGDLPPVTIADGPGVDGGTTGTARYAHFVRGLDMDGRNSIAGHALYLVAPKSGDYTCATIDPG